MNHLKKFTKFSAIMLAVVCTGGFTWGEDCQAIRTTGDMALAVDAPLADVRDALLECYPQELVDGLAWCISMPAVLKIPFHPEDDDDQGQQRRPGGMDRGPRIQGELILCGGVPPDYPGFVIQDPFGVGFDGLLFNNPGLYQTEGGQYLRAGAWDG